MPKHLLLLLFFLLNALLAKLTVQAQTIPSPSASFCGTTDLTAEQARELVRDGNRALRQKMTSSTNTQPVTFVPIRPHIIRRSNGTGGYSLASMNQIMALTNGYYLLNGMGIQFYFAGSTPDYIDNDDMYNSYNNQSVDAYDARNAMNQYYVNQFSNSGLGGYAYYPDNALYSTRSFILNENNIEDMGNRLVPHELGHNFNLIHTFGQNSGNGSLGTGVTTELVTRGPGANCTTDGDLICDTPADPYNMAGTGIIYSNGCPQYDPNGTARDANGDAYMPLITNIMSYYGPCTHDFTPGQYERMQAALALRQTHTAYTLDAPATNVTAPGNLTGSVSGQSIMLTWQANAANEMGYFIERSGSPDAGFVPIGGVAPNVSTYTDDKVVLNTQYYYRVRPSNTTTGSLSSAFAIKFIPFLTPTTTNITGTSAQLNWNSAGSGATYDVQWRAVGASSWIQFTNLPNFAITLSGLSVNTSYEWQVRTTGTVTYTNPVRFTTICPVPVPYTAYPSRTVASLSWLSGSSEVHRLQWRSRNTTDWTSIEGISSPYYSLSGLNPASPYEWRVQGTCPGSTTITTDFSPVQSFTTLSCPVPLLQVSSNSSTAVSLIWSTSFYETGRMFALRYRPVGSPNWTTIDQITTGEYTTYLLSGLTPNVVYEAQLKSVCSMTESSGYSATITFTPACQTPLNLYASPKASTAKLSWNTPNAYTPETDATFQLQYRPLGRTDWLTVSNIMSASANASTTYSLTGLTSNTTYEWRVRNSCPSNSQSDYATGTPFTTVCLAPSYAYGYLPTATSITLRWSTSVDPGTLFDVRYRVTGAADWLTLNRLAVTDNASTFAYSLTGLTNNKTYEWAIRTVCSAVDNSIYTSGQSFTTGCQIPSGLSVSPKTTSAYLSWALTGTGVTYDLRYRRTGTTAWTDILGLTTFSATITGLQTNAGYEWQVRSNCGDDIYSAYSVSSSFGTYPCYSPHSQSVIILTPTSAQLNWSFNYGDNTTRYQLRYRVVGFPDWTTLSNLTGAGISGSVVVTNLTTDSPYEWQIRTICSPTENSDFSASSLFQTCGAFYTLQAGFWYDTATWSCHRIPTGYDVVQIKHTVTLPAGYTATALRVLVDPGVQINYGTNARLKLGQ
ncbi:fibronectin type III domain-containing protein [Spirosoma spitsbergense]|uniref:fibronectin type III domain-containing protein n=1 Tax=Spirosoma spitsbergense TaxID=431554 RepID=UPI00036DF104|nr:fibronectin type III domain-containing protein [Spirosoma spitsbergense]